MVVFWLALGIVLHVFQYLTLCRLTKEEFLGVFYWLYLYFLCYFSQGGREIKFSWKSCGVSSGVFKSSFHKYPLFPLSSVCVNCLPILNSVSTSSFIFVGWNFTALHFSFITPLSLHSSCEGFIWTSWLGLRRGRRFCLDSVITVAQTFLWLAYCSAYIWSMYYGPLVKTSIPP